MKAPASPAPFPCLLVKDEHMLSWCSLSYLSESESAPDSERLPYGSVTFISMGLEKQMCGCNNHNNNFPVQWRPALQSRVRKSCHSSLRQGRAEPQWAGLFGLGGVFCLFSWLIHYHVLLRQRSCWPWGDDSDRPAGPYIYDPHFMDHEP